MRDLYPLHGIRLRIRGRFDSDDARPWEGLPGEYRGALLLVIPGESVFVQEVQASPLSVKSDSLIQMNRDHVPIEFFGQSELLGGVLVALNGVLNHVEVHVRAESMADARVKVYDAASRILSTLSFEWDTPLAPLALYVREEETGVVDWSVTVAGSKILVQFPEKGRFQINPDGELATLRSQYREALCSLNPFYKFLSFWKVAEACRQVAGRNTGQRTSKVVGEPLSPERFPPDFHGHQEEHFLTSFAGRKFNRAMDDMRDVLRNSIAHLTEAGIDFDRLSDEERCYETIPAIRFIARTMLRNEMLSRGAKLLFENF